MARIRRIRLPIESAVRDTRVTVLRHKVYPFPVLMVSISDDELQAYGKNHIFRKKVSGYRELVGIGISMKRYKEWHKKEVMKFSSLP